MNESGMSEWSWKRGLIAVGVACFLGALSELATAQQTQRARVFVTDANGVECNYGWGDVTLDTNNQGQPRSRATNTARSHLECANEQLVGAPLEVSTADGALKCSAIGRLSRAGKDGRLLIDATGECEWPSTGPEPSPPAKMTCTSTNTIECHWLPGYEPEGVALTPNGTSVDLRAGVTRVYEFQPMGPGRCETNPPAGAIDVKEAGDAIEKVSAITRATGATVSQAPNCALDSVTGSITFNPNAGLSHVCVVPLDEDVPHFYSIACEGGGKCRYFFRVDNFGGC